MLLTASHLFHLVILTLIICPIRLEERFNLNCQPWYPSSGACIWRKQHSKQ